MLIKSIENKIEKYSKENILRFYQFDTSSQYMLDWIQYHTKFVNSRKV